MWAASIKQCAEGRALRALPPDILPLQKEEKGAHYELLLRVRDEQGNIVAPDNFITAAELYGITPQIDRGSAEMLSEGGFIFRGPRTRAARHVLDQPVRGRAG